jgi:hypothetical protein
MRKWTGAWREETERETEEQAFGVDVMDPLLVSGTDSLGT